MTNSRIRLHIIGSQGNLGRHLVEIAKKDFEVFAYSSTLKKSDEKKAGAKLMPLDAAVSNIKIHEPVIFLSHSNTNQNLIKIRGLLNALKEQKPHLIYVSSLAVYSSYVSVYAEIKTEFERIVQTFDHFSIIRLGFVHGRTFGGISKVFSSLAKKRLLILPSDQIKTGFITLNKATDCILQTAKNDPSLAIINEYQSFLSIKRALDLFGFRGMSISFTFPSFRIVCYVAQTLRPITPHFIQSFLSISFISSKTFSEKNTYPYFRCFLIVDYARLFGCSDLWQLRKYIRNIERKNSLRKYLELDKKERFFIFVPSSRITSGRARSAIKKSSFVVYKR